MRFSLLAFVTLALLSAGACGNKQWPRPDLREESFSFSQVQGQRQGKCLLVSAVVQGASDNIGTISLQFERPSGCAECPFAPKLRIEYRSGDPRLLLENDRLSLSYCGLEPDQDYRWRLTGTPSLRPYEVIAGPVMPATHTSTPKE